MTSKASHSNKASELAIIGLGRMGGGLGVQAQSKGFKVFGFDPAKNSATNDLPFEVCTDIPHLLQSMHARPRRIFIYIPAGKAVDDVIALLLPHLEPDDIICDGGNSYWGDSVRRAKKLAESQIQFLDLGTSGGVDGALHGACFMAGGTKQAFDHVAPILTALAQPGGLVHAGPAGAGHFVKLVHNGIEFGMLQAIGEGVSLLENFYQELDISGTLNCWTKGSVIRSWLVELMAQQYQKHQGLKDIPDYIEDTGEVNWLVTDAMQMETPIPVISQSVMQLFTSRESRKNWASAIAMMRNGFGGHPFGEDEFIKEERTTSRVGDFYTSSVKTKE